jgi:hypothetical protein
MPAAHARIETGRASRYLTQLCQHVQSIYSSRGPLSHARPTPPAGHAQGRPAEPPRVAVQRLVQVTLAGLRPNAPSDGQDGR